MSRRTSTLILLSSIAVGAFVALLALSLQILLPAPWWLAMRVFACPLAFCIGLGIVRCASYHPYLLSGITYVISIFAAAKLERLLIGQAQGASTDHRLYFQIVIGLQIASALLIVWSMVRTPLSKSQPVE